MKPLTIEGTYEDGVLKLQQPIQLPEGTKVRLTITPVDADPLEDVLGVCDGPADGAEHHDRYVYGQDDS